MSAAQTSRHRDALTSFVQEPSTRADAAGAVRRNPRTAARCDIPPRSPRHRLDRRRIAVRRASGRLQLHLSRSAHWGGTRPRAVGRVAGGLRSVNTGASVEPMSWAAAQVTGERLMAAQEYGQGLTVQQPIALYLLRSQGLYEYRVRSTRDITDKYGSTSVYFDATPGPCSRCACPRDSAPATRSPHVERRDPRAQFHRGDGERQQRRRGVPLRGLSAGAPGETSPGVRRGRGGGCQATSM
jgi:hypothetical protein